MPSSACQTCALRSEEHTSELQSHDNLVCRLLLAKNQPTSVRPRIYVGPSPSRTPLPTVARAPVGAVAQLVVPDGERAPCTAHEFRVFFRIAGTPDLHPLPLQDVLRI